MTSDQWDGYWSPDEIRADLAREEAEAQQEREAEALEHEDDPDYRGYSRSDLLFGGNWS